MRDDDGHTRHYPDDNPCNSCAYATCRDRPHNFSASALGGESGLWTGGRVIKSQQPK